MTGDIRWSKDAAGLSNHAGGVGSLAGYVNQSGYRIIMIGGKNYKAHRLVWLHQNGKWPDGVIDHINRIPCDNRIENLRDVSQLLNGQNRGVPKHNRSGHRGVSFIKARNKWYASITFNGATINLGLHETLEKAVDARKTGEASYFSA